MALLDQRLRQALLALELSVIPADDGLQRRGGLHHRLRVEIGGQPFVFGNWPHWPARAGMFRLRRRGVKRPNTPAMMRPMTMSRPRRAAEPDGQRREQDGHV